MKNNNADKREQGAVTVFFAIILVVLLGFTAMAYEAGYWYLIRSELSKAADAGSLSAAANISNPYEEPDVLAENFGYENFPSAFLGTPESGEGAINFDAEVIDSKKVRVTGTVSVRATLARLFGLEMVSTQGVGLAERNEVELMLVLDRSGSMSGTPITRLKQAAKDFVDFFEDTQETDMMGLISFASTVVVNPDLGLDYVTAMKNQIDTIDASGATNIEDALRRAGEEGKGGLTDQTGMAGDLTKQQYVIFFSDGNPTAFREEFRYNNTLYDAVGIVSSNCGTNDNPQVWNYLGHHGENRTVHSEGPGSGEGYYSSTINPRNIGDGLRTSSSPQTYCWYYNSGWIRFLNTKWEVFEQDPVTPGSYHPDQCGLYDYRNNSNYIWQPSTYGPGTSDTTFYNRMGRHICNLAWDKAVENANYLKNDRNIKIFAIGLGDVNVDYIVELSSSDQRDGGFDYWTTTEEDLNEIFQEVARQIKLRLIYEGERQTE